MASIPVIDVTQAPYSAPTDGTTDAHAAIQAAITANPSAIIYLPNLFAADTTDYVVSQTLELKGPNQVLCGSTMGWFAGTVLKFPAGISGILVRNTVCPGATIRDLILIGSEPWSGYSSSEAILPRNWGGNPTTGSTADGIKIGANFVRVENVIIRYFGRHAIHIGDAQGALPNEPAIADLMADNFLLIQCWAFNCRGSGLMAKGGDSNAGTTIQFVSNINQLWGIDDQSFLGNAHISPQTHANHSYAWAAAGEQTAIAAAWTAAGMLDEGGSYRGADVPNIGNVYVNPYMEPDQPMPRFASKDLVLGGSFAGGADVYTIWLNGGANGINGPSMPFLAQTNCQDVGGLIQFKAGKTAPQNIITQVLNLDNTIRWAEVRGTYPNGWTVWEGPAWGSLCRLELAAGGACNLNAAGVGPVAVNMVAGSGTGGMAVGDGAGNVAAHLTAGGAIQLKPVADANAPIHTVYIGSDHDGAACNKNTAGLVTILGAAGEGVVAGPPGVPGVPGPPGPPGPSGQPTAAVVRHALIARGETTVTVEHDLGGEPRLEDVGVMPYDEDRVWLAGVTPTQLTFRTNTPAPSQGVRFVYSAKLYIP